MNNGTSNLSGGDVILTTEDRIVQFPVLREEGLAL